MANDAAIRFEFEKTLMENGFDPVAARLAATAMQTGSSELMDRALKHYTAKQAVSGYEDKFFAEQKRMEREQAEAAEIDNIAAQVEAVMGIKVSDRERREALQRAREQQAALDKAQDPAEIERQARESMDPYNEFCLDQPLDFDLKPKK